MVVEWDTVTVTGWAVHVRHLCLMCLMCLTRPCLLFSTGIALLSSMPHAEANIQPLDPKSRHSSIVGKNIFVLVT